MILFKTTLTLPGSILSSEGSEGGSPIHCGDTGVSIFTLCRPLDSCKDEIMSLVEREKGR